MATIKSPRPSSISPSAWFGLIGLLLCFAGCKPDNTPEGVALAFWQALAANDSVTARDYTSNNAPTILNVPALPELHNATLKTGQIILNDASATVDILITHEHKPVITLQTFLIKENNSWKVEYQRTVNNLRQAPFNDFFKSLEDIGETLNQQLEQGLELFGEELKKQVDEFGRELQKNLPKKRSPTDGSI